MRILVGDVGGTNTRLALAERVGEGWSLSEPQVFATPDVLAPLLREYAVAHAAQPAQRLALCGAGPRRADGRIALTNRPTVLDPDELAAAADVARCVLLNDFEAVAWCLPALAPGERRALGGGAADESAPRIALGAGTGLGVAALLREGQGWRVLPGEGGHVDLAPVDEREHGAWLRLRAALGRVSAEQVFSGPGVARLHAALHPGHELSAPELGRRLLEGEAQAVETAAVFARWLGRYAGNAALQLNAGGGVYLAGGIVPAWGERFDAAAFRAGFEDKAPFSGWLAGVPAWVVTHRYPGLLGLAVAAGAQAGA